MPRLRDTFYWGMLGTTAVVYLVLAMLLPVVDDEAYYWCWAQKPQVSYFDHAPLSAYMILLSTNVLGDSVFALRFPAVVSSLTIVAVLGAWMRPRFLWPYVIVTPAFTFGAVLITPDTPLLLFWTLYLVWLHDTHQRLKPKDATTLGEIPALSWLIGGVLLGLGAMGKYTMALAVPAGFLTFMLAAPRDVWRWLPGYLSHGVVSFVVFLPVIYFNIEQDFVPIRFQWEHANAASGSCLKGLGEFLGTQLLLFGLFPLLLLPWVWKNIRTLSNDPLLRVCCCMYAVPMSFFLYKSCKSPLEGNWALAAYLGFWPVAAHWHGQFCPAAWRRTARIVGLGLPFACVILLTAHWMYPMPFITAKQDRIARQHSRTEAARYCTTVAKNLAPNVPVYTPTYQWTALLNYTGAPAYQMRVVSRPSHFTVPGSMPKNVDEILIWNESPLPHGMMPEYECVGVLGYYPITVGDHIITCMMLLKYRLKTESESGSKILGFNSKPPTTVALTSGR